MATRSAIGIEVGMPEMGLGVIHAVYCHWDGYVEHQGPLLLEHFSLLSSARELIGAGSISCLGKGMDKTIFHYRDMKHEMQPAEIYDGRAQFIEQSDGLDYLYLLNQDNVWEVFSMHKPWRGWQLVKDALTVVA